ncbi:MAG: hypothetical protein CSB33_00715 [Desulfobacterales bacterium]|nr:MAG: hypothetical protein CSB33_00715 [Desulfobacterales bacterium]
MEKAKDVDEYIARHRQIIEDNPDCGASMYNLAVALIAKKEYNEAEKYLYRSLDNSPGLAEAYIQLGGLCLRRGDMEGCLDFNRQAVRAKPGFAEGWGNIGFVHLQRGELEDAITALRKATAFNFRFVQAFASLASAYLMNGNIDESIETGHKVLELAPDFAVAHNNLAIAYMEQDDWEKAIAHCDRAISGGYDVPEEIRREIDAHRQS